MRVAILGNSGSGKSTLARRMAAAHGVPVLHLDSIVWEPHKLAVARAPEDQHAAMERFADENDQWVVEGCYASLVGTALRHWPELWFLDLAEQRCLQNCRNRPWEPDKYQSKRAQDEQLPLLLEWVKGYYTRDGDLSRRACGAVRKLRREQAKNHGASYAVRQAGAVARCPAHALYPGAHRPVMAPRKRALKPGTSTWWCRTPSDCPRPGRFRPGSRFRSRQRPCRTGNGTARPAGRSPWH